MNNNNKKKFGFTLIEIVIAMVLFSITAFVFYSAMLTIYKNSKIEFYITKKAFASVDHLETAATAISDEELKPGERLDSAKRKNIEDKILRNHGEIKHVQNIVLFSGNAKYKTVVEGYFLSRQMLVGNTSNSEDTILTYDQEKKIPKDHNIKAYYVYFVANDQKKELKAPEYEFAKILKHRGSDDGYATDYTYYNSVKNGNALLAARKVTDDTKKYLFYENLDWQFSEKKDKDGNFFKPHNTLIPAKTPVESADLAASKRGDNYKNGAQIKAFDDIHSLIYPFDNEYFKSLNLSVKYFKERKGYNFDHDGYLRFIVEPVPKIMVKLSPVKADGIWLITLPVTHNLLFHFDMALAKGNAPVSMPDGRQKQETNFIRELSPDLYNDMDVKKGFEPVNPSKKVNLFSDKSNGRYIELDSSSSSTGVDQNALVFKNIRKDLGNIDYNFYYYIFLVLDTKGASPGTILKGTNTAFSLEYRGSNTFKFFGGNPPESDIEKAGKSRDAHIVVLNPYMIIRSGWVRYWRYNAIAVDDLNFSTSNYYRYNYQFNLDNPLYLGGARGLKVREIIAYKGGNESPLSEGELKEIYNYLANKYEIAPLP